MINTLTFRGVVFAANKITSKTKILPMKKLLLLTIFAAGFSTTTIHAQPQTTPGIDPSAPVMTFENDTIDFGTVKEGTSVERDFVFKNTGKTPLIITSASGSCSCTVPHYPEQPIAPGKTGVIHVVFNSAGKMGVQNKTATIVSNSSDGSIVLVLKGTVVAAVAK